MLRVAAPDASPGAHSASRTRSSRSGSRWTARRRSTAICIPDLDRGAVDRRPAGVPAGGVRGEARPSSGPRSCSAREPGVAWNAGHVPVAAARDPRGARGAHAAHAGLAPASSRRRARRGLRGAAVDLHRLRGHGAGRGATGRVVMAAMDVGWSDLGGWTALLAAIGAGGTGRVVPAGETVDARRRRPARPRRPVRRFGSPRARAVRSAPTGPKRCSPARRAIAAASRSSSTASPNGRPSQRDDHRRGPGARPTSSSAPTAGARGSPTTSRSRTSAAAPTAWPSTSSSAASRRRASSSPTTAGSRREYFAQAAAEVLLARDIPVAYAAHAGADADVVVRGRRARRRRPAS